MTDLAKRLAAVENQAELALSTSLPLIGVTFFVSEG